MADFDGNDGTELAGVEDRPAVDNKTLIVFASIAFLVLAGMVVVGVAGALESSDDCSTYGYGGYGCVDYEDAQATVEPSTDLVDRQTVSFVGSDFDPHFVSFAAAQCDASLVEELEADACDLSTTAYSFVDGDGGVQFDMTVRRVITTAAGGETDCAVPDACVIGAGTFEGFATPIEGVILPISFDPDVPPVPPLEIELSVDGISGGSASGTVVCNREASFYLDGELRQERGGQTAGAYGYMNEEVSCDTDEQEWTLVFRNGSRRLSGGPAVLNLYGYAYDGFDSANVQETLDVRLQGSDARPPVPSVEMDGEHTTIRIVDVVGSGADQQVVVEVYCGRPSDDASVYVSLSQWAGRDLVTAYGYKQLANCDGVHAVQVPIMTSGGVLAGGPARVDAEISVHGYEPPDYFYDYASATGEVRLSGELGGEAFDPEPNPDSRITIDSVTRSTIAGTVECDESVMVEISGYGVRKRGRTLEQASGYDFIECEGTTPFTLDLAMYGDGLPAGQAAVSVSAYAYRIIEMDDYDYYEYVWDDMQQASVRVRGSG